MKKVSILLAVLVLLSGCSVQTFETVDDPNDVVVMATPAQLTFDLPDHAASAVMQGASGSLYFCDGYTITVQTLTGGDLNRSLQTLTGYSRESLTVVQTQRGSSLCYSCAWTSAGEGGDQVGRLVLLDDGTYHYAVTVMAPAAEAGNLSEIWDDILNRVTLRSTDA